MSDTEKKAQTEADATVGSKRQADEEEEEQEVTAKKVALEAVRDEEEKGEGEGKDEKTSPAAASVNLTTQTAPTAPASASGEEGSLTLRSIVDAKTVGSLIGRQGVVIKQIREGSGAKVNISDSGAGSDRIVTAAGTPTQLFVAYSYIAQKLLEFTTQVNPTETTVSIRLCIPNCQAGLLIGAQGATINLIREKTGADISLDKECLPASTERPCKVAGKPEAVGQAVFYVAHTLLSVPPKDQTVLYRPEAQTAPSYGYGAAATGGGAAYAGAAYSAGAGYGGAAAAGGFQQTHQMFIPNEMAGAIIGRGGSKINEIRSVSQASVKIGDPGLNGNRTVTITGAPQSVQMAAYMIQQKLQEGMQTNPSLQQVAAAAFGAAAQVFPQ